MTLESRVEMNIVLVNYSGVILLLRSAKTEQIQCLWLHSSQMYVSHTSRYLSLEQSSFRDGCSKKKKTCGTIKPTQLHAVFENVFQ